MEKWKKVKGYEGIYEISNEGRVRSLQRDPPRIMCLETHIKGYFRIMLSNKTKTERFFVHRLVGEAFIPNPEGKAIVNHKDGDKKNNRLSNLEWATESENTQHYHDILKPARTPVTTVPDTIDDADLPW